ncbi:sodium- and chloride-dependent betaine transporter [Platysternon megacephalum]|uniref:Sodium-and chloride-dependent betaine transporter n=1 Tax=Platysternon megacephalum TaxID=55544 RepID=A0A4D9E4R9_9SAUR|nr:sodium- and chloride-dependent betaine transporter [Platysternon megacephalum]
MHRGCFKQNRNSGQMAGKWVLEAFSLLFTQQKKNCKHLYAKCACGVKCAGQLLWPMSVPKNCEVAELVFKMSYFTFDHLKKPGGSCWRSVNFCLLLLPQESHAPGGEHMQSPVSKACPGAFDG